MGRDSQHLPSWRELVVATALSLRRHHTDTLIVPMSLIRDAYRAEILGGLADAGEEVLHVLLEAEAGVLRERLNARVTHPGRQWDQAASECWPGHRADSGPLSRSCPISADVACWRTVAVRIDDGAVSCRLASMDGHVTLRPVVEDDLSWLASLRNDPTATGPHEWHGWSDPQWERRRWAESGLLGDNGGTLVVVHGTDRVGTVSWRRVQTGPTASNWALGIGLAPEFRGRGYGSEAQRLLVRYLFAHTQVNRIEATTEITNVAEQRALEKAGFTREGILRGTTFRQGRWHDQVLFSVLRDEVKLEDSAAADGLA